MADEELYGVGIVRIELDDDRAVQQARTVGAQIEAALLRATRRTGERIQAQIERGLRRITADVEITSNLVQFRSALEQGLQGFDEVRVPVTPELSNFEGSLYDNIASIDPIEIPVEPDMSGFELALELGVADMDPIEIPVEPDLTTFNRELSARLSRIDAVTIPVTADIRRFRTVVNRLNDLDGINIRARPTVDPARFRRELQRLVNGVYVRVPVLPDLTRFDEAIERHRVPALSARVEADVDTNRLSRSLSSITSSLSGALKSLAGLAGATLAIGGLGIAAAGAAVAVGGLLAALAPAAGIVAALPAVVLGFVAATNALKLALSGVGDAFGAALGDDAAKFEKTLKELSPAARAAALEVRALKPQFDALKTSVQDAFFKRFEGDLTRTAKALNGPVKTGLTNIASAWGRAARNALGYIQGAQGVSNIQSILAATNQAVGGLSQGTNKLTAGLLQSAAAISDAFGAELGGGISAALERFGTFLSTAAGDGRLVAWVNGALDVLAQLGDLLGNIGGIISGLFEAASASGGGFLGNLQKITQSFETFVNSAKGQEAIGNIFATLGTVAAQLGPIFSALVSAIGQIAPALAPLFTAIGPAITSLINALGPAIQALMPGITAVVNAIVSALGSIASSGVLTQIGAAFGEVLKAIAPIIPFVGQLVTAFAQALAPAITTLAKALAPVIKAFTEALAPVLPVLVTAFTTLVTALGPLVAMIGQTLAGVIQAFAPLLLTLATAFASIATAVQPLIAQLIEGLAPIINAIAPIISRLVSAIAPLIIQLVEALLPVLPPIIDAFLAILAALIPLIEPVVQLVEALAPLVELIIKAIAPILEMQAGFLSMAVIEVVVPIIEGLVKALVVLIEVVTTAVNDIVAFGRIVELAFETLKTNGITSIGELVSRMIAYFAGLFDKVFLAVGLWVQGMQEKFSQLKDGVIQRVRDTIDDVVGFFQSLPGKARAALNNLGGSLGDAVANAGTTLRDRVRKLVNDAVTEIKSLPAKARSALGGLGGSLVGAGQDLIQGLINGVRSKAGEIAGAASNVVKGAISAAKNALGIASPSKVFIEIGKFVGQGLVKGLTGSRESVRKSSEALVDQITRAFKGLAGKTRVDDQLIASVRATQAELERLADRREGLGKRIQEANEFAVKTAQSALSNFSLNDLFGKVNAEIKKFKDNVLAKGLLQNVKFDTIDPLIDQVEASAARIRRFNDQVNNLARRGLRRDLIEQLIGLGPEAGADLAQQLNKASAAQIKELNAAQAELAKAANQFGKNSADKMFDAGKDAADGFLAGLKSQQKAISDLMVQIANASVAAIKKALKIKSPSRVMMGLGKDTGLGYANGIKGMEHVVSRASERLATSVTNPFGRTSAGAPSLRAEAPVSALANRFGSSDTGSSSQGSQGGVTGSTSSTGLGTTINNTFNLTAVGDAETTARRVAARMALDAGIA